MIDYLRKFYQSRYLKHKLADDDLAKVTGGALELLAKVNKEEAEAIRLCYIYKRSRSFVADELGISQATLYRRLTNGLWSISEFLDERTLAAITDEVDRKLIETR